MRYLWGGEMRHVFTRRIGNDQHTWVVGDGGIVRHRVGAGGFEIQRTPLDARHSLHDVFFLPDGSKGWACGNGGRILETSDLGATWTLLPPTLPNCQGQAGGAGGNLSTCYGIAVRSAAEAAAVGYAGTVQ